MACKDVLEHLNDPNVSYGENMYMSTGNNVTAFMAVEAWYNENKKYNYKSPGFDPRSEHFTQVVWRNTKKLGTAVTQKFVYFIKLLFSYSCMFQRRSLYCCMFILTKGKCSWRICRKCLGTMMNVIISIYIFIT